MSDSQPVPLNRIHEFARIAKRYRAWIGACGPDAKQNIKDLQHLLAELHHSILAMPDVANVLFPSGHDDSDEEEVSFETNSAVDLYVPMKTPVLPIEGYYEIFEPNAKEEAPVYNTLSDDLGDIYRDLGEGLELYDQEKFIEAAYDWRLSFYIHWGRHLVTAQRDSLWRRGPLGR
jgi:hypothetical protein